MKGIILAVAAAALLVGCATDNRGGMSDDVYRETGGYERTGDLSPAEPGDAELGQPNAAGFPRTTAPGGVGLGQPR